jgi:cytoskeletal protein RodZ
MTPPDHAHALDPGIRRRPTRPATQPEAENLISERLRARSQRISAIRKRVVTVAVVVFMALWGVIFVQLVSGNDPALAHKKTVSASVSSASSAPAVSTSSTTGASTSGTTSSTASSGSGTTTSASSGSSSPSAVTTHQS